LIKGAFDPQDRPTRRSSPDAHTCRRSRLVIAHDALAQLTRTSAPTQITFGRHDLVTSTRFADAMKNGIKRSELLVFESCSHAPIYESVSEFNEKTLSFPSRQTG
jgi:pimeloyl-ACP methyl ester carboxylesterase